VVNTLAYYDTEVITAVKKFYSTGPRIETSSVSKLKCHFETFFDTVFLHLRYFDDSSNVRSLAFQKIVGAFSC
jgi:hypothetical protein